MKFKLFFLCTIIANSILLSENQHIHSSHIAGRWYPHNKTQLQEELDYYFSLAQTHFNIAKNGTICALIVPHAGYAFSGLCAATAYQTIKGSSFDRVIIIGPSHRKNFNGIALPDYQICKTPLGSVSVDTKAIQTILNYNDLFKIIPGIHQSEHSIEIQIPFLQTCLDNFSIIPLAVGILQEKDFKAIVNTIRMLLTQDKKTIIIISSDFIHYGKRFGYTPKLKDVATFDHMAIDAICKKSYQIFEQTIKKTKATICGKAPIKILLQLIQTGIFGNIQCNLTSYYNSAQITASRIGKKIDISKLSQAVPKKSSVSYASFICQSTLTAKEKKILLQHARHAITQKLFPKKTIPKTATITENLKRQSGAFVTIKTKSGKLRGCIGNILTTKPLYKTIPAIAVSSAFHDPRFAPLKKEELANTTISITVLSPPRSIKSYKDIIIGTHGIILEKIINNTKKNAVFLPQVATEQRWNLPETLTHLAQKAGLQKNAWKEGCQFKVFEGFDFSE